MRCFAEAANANPNSINTVQVRKKLMTTLSKAVEHNHLNRQRNSEQFLHVQRGLLLKSANEFRKGLFAEFVANSGKITVRHRRGPRQNLSLRILHVRQSRQGLDLFMNAAEF